MSNILDKWEINADELTHIVDENPSLRGFMMGYISEYKVRSLFIGEEKIEQIFKHDDHDRKSKGDVSLIYRGVEIDIEAKTVQSNSVKSLGDDRWIGKFQCDASDCRNLVLPNGHEVTTTSLKVGEFDIVAVNLFPFGDKWRFVFARNEDLPHPKPRSKYDPEDVEYLIKTTINVSWPPEPPFTTDIYELLDKVYESRFSEDDEV